MVALPELQALVHATYSRIWQDWYADHLRCTAAELRVEMVTPMHADSYYSHTKNLIVIYTAEDNLNDRDLLDAPSIPYSKPWQLWMVDLSEEMLHEYEAKVLVTPTPAGATLFSANRWPLHDALFNSAVCDRAAYFGLDPQQFLEVLRGKLLSLPHQAKR